MKKTPITINALALNIKFKNKFRHASASRHEGESIWVRAGRNGLFGYGEGCPREYVAGDDLDTSIAWVKNTFSSTGNVITGLDGMTEFTDKNSDLIDRFPSAWCAVEMALLDLLARENGTSVEEFIGCGHLKRKASYSAVLGNDKTWRYTFLVDQYLIKGMTDFKVKITGHPEKDQKKLTILKDVAEKHGQSVIRIRLDANNLWAGNTDEAIRHIKCLDGDFFAVEEPVTAGDAEEISRFSVETGLPVILDETLLKTEDLDRFRNLPGRFIANIKISKVGGILRALRMIETLKTMNWPIIIGCHVGETSLLTRAGMIAASAAGDNLTAHEGAFGDYLVEWEPVKPMLRFGRNGSLDLDSTYYYKTGLGIHLVHQDNWDSGLGMECRMPFDKDTGSPLIRHLEMPDGYNIHYRTWGKTEGGDVLFVLHGGMSHSGWQAPLAESVRALQPSLTVVAPDRRGCGLNTNRGDLGTVDAVITDVTEHILYLKKHFKRIHVAGWCQGCQYAAIAASRLGDAVDSLILLTPGFFWNERFRSVLTMAEKTIMSMITEFDMKPGRDEAKIPIPMEGLDFTINDSWLDFIETDELKTTRITLKSASIMDEIQELSWPAIIQTTHPTLMILADRDRIVDNAKVLQFIGHKFEKETGNRMIRVDSGHAVQFEKPGIIAQEIIDHIRENHPETGRPIANQIHEPVSQ